ncbi:MAG: MATE family efflux transporter, partial [Spirochaetales bacterium]|nr:MATE family efflux transporter [Spirochaetales bacterium]
MQPIAENKMGVKPIPSLVLSMSFPIMLSMLVQALYNVVDSLYVSHYSQDALTALTLAFPLQNLLIAVSVGTSIGINSLI